MSQSFVPSKGFQVEVKTCQVYNLCNGICFYKPDRFCNFKCSFCLLTFITVSSLDKPRNFIPAYNVIHSHDVALVLSELSFAPVLQGHVFLLQTVPSTGRGAAHIAHCPLVTQQVQTNTWKGTQTNVQGAREK